MLRRSEEAEHQQVMAWGVVATPGLAVNRKLVCAGRVLPASEVMTLVANVLADEDRGSRG